MKIPDRILNWKSDKLAFRICLPLLVSALIAVMAQTEEVPLLSMLVFGLGVSITIGSYILYTTLLPFQLLDRKPPLGHAILTITLLSMVFVVPMALGEYLFLFYWAFALSHLVLTYRIAKLILAQEQRKGIWEYLILMWLLFNPLLGLWSYKRRLENLNSMDS